MADSEKKKNIFKRIGGWFKSLNAERKKISWVSWKSVRSNTLIVIVTIIVVSAAIGLVDYLLMNGIVGLGHLI